MDSKNAAILDLLKVAELAANAESSVLITGENGKEFFARMLHLRSSRREKPFVRFNCASLAESAQNEFFACLKEAGEGTFFIDEVGFLSLDLQQCLLQVLKNPSALPDGVECCARIVATSSENLDRLVQDGKFIDDLFFALNALSIHIPPLQDSAEAVARNLPQDELVSLFGQNGQKPLKEAENIFKKCYIRSILQAVDFNQTKTAKILGIQRTYLSRLLNELGLRN